MISNNNIESHTELPLGHFSDSQGENTEKFQNSEIQISGLAFEDLCPVLQSCVKSTEDLVQLLTVVAFEKEGGAEAQNLKLTKLVKEGKMKIDRAVKMIESYKNEKKTQGQNALTEALDHVHYYGNAYELHNKDSKDLKTIPDSSVQTCVISPPYFVQRVYPDGVMTSEQLGSEDTTNEYVNNSVNQYYSEIYRVLNNQGSLFINIADSYKGTSCLVIHKLIMSMVEAKWHLVGDWTWQKTNPKPLGKIKRLRPSTERILHFVKDPKNYYFREFIHWKQGELFGVQRGCNDATTGDKKDKVKWSLKKPIKRFTDFLEEQVVAGVIKGSAFNWAELRKIDPDFSHLAPFPSYLPILPILMTSKIGDTVLDIYNGTGTTAEVALQLGRNAVGYDTDPKSIEFSKKRLDLVEQNLPSIAEISDFEKEYMAAA